MSNAELMNGISSMLLAVHTIQIHKYTHIQLTDVYQCLMYVLPCAKAVFFSKLDAKFILLSKDTAHHNLQLVDFVSAYRLYPELFANAE